MTRILLLLLVGGLLFQLFKSIGLIQTNRDIGIGQDQESPGADKAGDDKTKQSRSSIVDADFRDL